MKISLLILSLVFLTIACKEEPDFSGSKDLGQHMMDLRIYQENLGDQIKAKRLENASWLLEGMDRILLVLNKQFKAHRKLSAPFSYYYRKELRQPIRGIRAAIAENDTAKALQSYRLLIRNCNDCHINQDIDKDVKF